MTTTTPTRAPVPYSASAAINEAQAMYGSEIHFMLFGFWDGGIGWYLGGSPDPTLFMQEAIDKGHAGNSQSIERALVEMANHARGMYPQSDFTRGRPQDISVPSDHRWLYEYIGVLHSLSGAAPSIRFEPSEAHRPDGCPFTVCWDDDRVGYMGVTPEGAVLEAIRQHLPWTIVESPSDDPVWSVVAGNPVTNDPLLGYTVWEGNDRAQADAMVEGHSPIEPTPAAPSKSVSDIEFRALLTFLMASDPSPAPEYDSDMVALANRLAEERGYDGWVEAFHQHVV